MVEFHEYNVRLKGDGAKTGEIDSPGDALPALAFGSPPEFGGPGRTWSPEHLFVASISTCLMTTFFAIADIAGLDVVDYRDDATGELRRGDDRLYRMDRVTLRPVVLVSEASKVAKARRLLEKAEQVCLISRSVSSEIVLEAEVSLAERVT